jgi:small-conductance mechanosensitive channel
MLLNEINKIKFLLRKVISDLELADLEEFTVNFENAKVRMFLIKKIKDKLIKDYPIAELQKFDAELVPLAKQIHKIYDNIIEKKRKQLQEVVKQLSQIQNKKKLINYNR